MSFWHHNPLKISFSTFQKSPYNLVKTSEYPEKLNMVSTPLNFYYVYILGSTVWAVCWTLLSTLSTPKYLKLSKNFWNSSKKLIYNFYQVSIFSFSVLALLQTLVFTWSIHFWAREFSTSFVITCFLYLLPLSLKVDA